MRQAEVSWKLTSKLAMTQHFVTVSRHLLVATQPTHAHLHTAGPYFLESHPPKVPSLQMVAMMTRSQCLSAGAVFLDALPGKPQGAHSAVLYWPTKRKNTASLWPRRRGGCPPPPPPSKSLYRCFSPKHPQSAMRVQCATWVWKAAAMTGHVGPHEHSPSETEP